MNNEEAKIAHSESIERWLMFGGKYLELVVEALDKQVAKKPIEDEYCPICGASLELDGDYGYIHKLKYCQRCGQKIDWSDEYDE